MVLIVVVVFHVVMVVIVVVVVVVVMNRYPCCPWRLRQTNFLTNRGPVMIHPVQAEHLAMGRSLTAEAIKDFCIALFNQTNHHKGMRVAYIWQIQTEWTRNVSKIYSRVKRYTCDTRAAWTQILHNIWMQDGRFESARNACEGQSRFEEQSKFPKNMREMHARFKQSKYGMPGSRRIYEEYERDANKMYTYRMHVICVRHTSKM